MLNNSLRACQCGAHNGIRRTRIPNEEKRARGEAGEAREREVLPDVGSGGLRQKRTLLDLEKKGATLQATVDMLKMEKADLEGQIASIEGTQ